jgi:hypothetical protein
VENSPDFSNIHFTLSGAWVRDIPSINVLSEKITLELLYYCNFVW